MNHPTFRAVRCAALLAPAVAACALWLPAPAAAELSRSANRVQTVCAQPPPGFAGCLAMRLVANAPLSVPGARALSRAAHTEGSPSPAAEAAPTIEYTEPRPGSLTPAGLLAAYSLPAAPQPASTQTIGIVDAYNDSKAEADLATYDQKLGLPACTKANGCFRRVSQTGKEAPLPGSNPTWDEEISTDIETAHGLCQNCHIVLVEATNAEYANLEKAEDTAISLGATEISNSWGGGEPASDGAGFNHEGVVITASTGDSGYDNWFEGKGTTPAEYPAASPHVIAVGGTRLSLVAGAWAGETVWNDGGAGEHGEIEGHGVTGGGCSSGAAFPAPAWQQSLPNWSAVGCGTDRAAADVSADADPYTGAAVYDSTEFEGSKGWGVIGGTSLASPIIASVFALAGGAHEVPYPASTLYQNELNSPSSLHDVTTGSNGECLKPFDNETGTSGCTSAVEAESCSGQAICLAGVGYDGPSGLGTPDGLRAFEPSTEPEGTPGNEEGTAPGKSPAAPGGESPSGTSATGAGGTSSSAGGATSASLSGPLTPVLSGLSLTRSAVVALNRQRPKASLVAFAFTLNMTARVRVTLARQIRVGRHLRWVLLGGSLTITAAKGHNSRHLTNHAALAAGRYQLTLAPVHGTARSLTFKIA